MKVVENIDTIVNDVIASFKIDNINVSNEVINDVVKPNEEKTKVLKKEQVLYNDKGRK